MPSAQGSRRAIRQVAFHIAPKSRHIFRVLRFTIPLPQARKNTQDLGVSLQTQNGIAAPECIFVKAGLLRCYIPVQHPRGEGGVYITTRIF